MKTGPKIVQLIFRFFFHFRLKHDRCVDCLPCGLICDCPKKKCDVFYVHLLMCITLERLTRL